jgi:hypothetical protein
MPYAFVQDVPADAALWEEIKTEVGDRSPPGLVVHLVQTRTEGGLRYVDVWDDEASWEAYRVEVVEPAVDRVLARYGIPHDHSLVHLEPIDLVDLWIPRR